ADSDLAHLKARRGEITELMQGGMGFVQPKDKPTAGLDEESVRQPCDAAFSISNPAGIAIWWSQSICLCFSQTADCLTHGLQFSRMCLWVAVSTSFSRSKSA